MSSPNFELSKAVLGLGNYQLTSGKGNASGYAGLGSQATPLIDPVNFLPNFSAEANGSFWVKSGSTLAPLSGTTFTSNALTIGGVLMGITSSGVYGIKQTSVNSPLVLLGGSTLSQVWIGLNQTLLGGTSGNYDTPLWSITGAGVCVFKATTFGGTVTMGGNHITGAGTISGATVLLTGGISSTGTLALTATSGVTVPTITGALPVTTNAVNFVSANTYYGKLSTVNTWATTQTFTVRPTFTSGLEIADTNGLQTALDNRLLKAGGTMTGAIAMGTSKITGLGTPYDDADAATKAYVDGKTITSNGGILTNLAVTVLGVGGGNVLQKTMSGNVTTLTLAQAGTSTSGYLSSADYNTFKAVGDLSGVNISPNLVLSGPATGVSAALPVYRSLVPADLATSVLKTINYTTAATVCAANATTETAEISFAGAAVGDFVIVSLPATTFTANISVSAYVSSGGYVKVRYANHTVASITLTAQNIKIGIIKFV